MEITAKELRTQPGKIVERAAKGIEIIISVRGRRIAKIVPLNEKSENDQEIQDEIFGLWKDKELDSAEYVRNIRAGRAF